MRFMTICWTVFLSGSPLKTWITIYFVSSGPCFLESRILVFTLVRIFFEILPHCGVEFFRLLFPTFCFNNN